MTRSKNSTGYLVVTCEGTQADDFGMDGRHEEIARQVGLVADWLASYEPTGEGYYRSGVWLPLDELSDVNTHVFFSDQRPAGIPDDEDVVLWMEIDFAVWDGKSRRRYAQALRTAAENIEAGGESFYIEVRGRGVIGRYDDYVNSCCSELQLSSADQQELESFPYAYIQESLGLLRATAELVHRSLESRLEKLGAQLQQAHGWRGEWQSDGSLHKNVAGKRLVLRRLATRADPGHLLGVLYRVNEVSDQGEAFVAALAEDLKGTAAQMARRLQAGIEEALKVHRDEPEGSQVEP